ncbi:Cloroperoxidase, partial [Bimuria novae-zelandiae CBS 107.79]
LTILPLVACFPGIHPNLTPHPEDTKRQTQTPISVRQPAFLSGRKNTGVFNDAPTFNAAVQCIDVKPGSGHEFRAPGANDERGPCPALNAAANHGFLPRSGIVSASQVVVGLKEAFNVGFNFAFGGSVLGIVYGGDIVSKTWSIGGAYAASVPLLSEAPGLLGTHGKYEGDGSPSRADAYFHNGNVNVFDYEHFTHMYELGTEYTHDLLAAHAEYRQQHSMQKNPYFFLNPVNFLLLPGANGLIINIFSNHSAETPGGTLNHEVLKSFFAVTGEPGSFVWKEGHERIPENWCKRPDDLGFEHIAADALVNNAMYPGQIAVGGNLGKVNTFTGVELGKLTGGTYDAKALLEGDNLACFVLQASQQAMPGQLKGPLNLVDELLRWVTDQLEPLTSKLSCPQLSNFRKEMFA